MTVHTEPAPAPGASFHWMAKTLHWVIAVLVFVVLPLGIMQKLVQEEYYGAVNFLHESLGGAIFLLMLLRLLVRALTRTPGPAPGTPRWAVRLAGWVQGLLYALLLGEPILGHLTGSAQGFPLVWLHLIPVWTPIAKSDAAVHVLLPMHGLVALLIALLIVLHIAGALYHRIVLRDDTLARMT